MCFGGFWLNSHNNDGRIIIRKLPGGRIKAKRMNTKSCIVARVKITDL